MLHTITAEDSLTNQGWRFSSASHPFRAIDDQGIQRFGAGEASDHRCGSPGELPMVLTMNRLQPTLRERHKYAIAKHGDMDRDEQAKYETRVKVLKALTHPARLKLVDVLPYERWI